MPVEHPEAATPMLSDGGGLAWRTDFESGHEVIDAQHRSLLENANALLEASQRGTPEVLARFDELLSHVMGHFADEEQVLRDAGYEGFAAHRRAHLALTEQAVRLREAMILGHHRHSELLRFLVVEVVQEHMLTEDRKFFPVVARARV